jgi:hypothetical protein
MEKGIRELDEYCRLHNYSIKFNRARKLCGFKTFDYAVKVGVAA